jgi:hypothetical protein
MLIGTPGNLRLLQQKLALLSTIIYYNDLCTNVACCNKIVPFPSCEKAGGRMHERPLAKPKRLLISLLAVGLLTGVVVFAGGSIVARAVPQRQISLTDLTDTADSQTFAAEDTADAMTEDADAKTVDAEDTADAQTSAADDTASAQTDTAQQEDSTPTSTTTHTGTPGSGVATAPASTSTLRPSALPTPSLNALSPNPIPTPINQVPTLLASVPPTPTPLLADAMTCPPGVRILLRGKGPARAAFLLFFGTRAVGGGSVAADGTFTAPLVVGNERAGAYPVVVRLRGTPRILLQRICTVPAVTPLPQTKRP